jgi:hypothetical protein
MVDDSMNWKEVLVSIIFTLMMLIIYFSLIAATVGVEFAFLIFLIGAIIFIDGLRRED